MAERGVGWTDTDADNISRDSRLGLVQQQQQQPEEANEHADGSCTRRSYLVCGTGPIEERESEFRQQLSRVRRGSAPSRLRQITRPLLLDHSSFHHRETSHLVLVVDHRSDSPSSTLESPPTIFSSTHRGQLHRRLNTLGLVSGSLLPYVKSASAAHASRLDPSPTMPSTTVCMT